MQKWARSKNAMAQVVVVDRGRGVGGERDVERESFSERREKRREVEDKYIVSMG
jgi:hypothetical protein